MPDQIIDRTQKRLNTFFGEGIVAHIQFADPFCTKLSGIVYQAAKEAGAIVHQGGTFIAMEGPAFSTRAESCLYKSWGADVLGMTVLPEAKLGDLVLVHAGFAISLVDEEEAKKTWQLIAEINDFEETQNKISG